ncbi:MAG TPA: DinB family protein [Candidatus Limnocylindria bacterium]|nr:DinB family protein [Candidatus Limnocylindria bacterium]
MDDTDALREQLTRLLRGQDAHMDFLEAVADFPDEAVNDRAPNVTYTPWQLAEHVRITQWDILEYVRNPSHVSPDWPIGYWPDPEATATPEAFATTVAGFTRDREALLAIVADASVDLLAPMAHAPRHSVGREIRVVADHTAYHTGEFAILRQVMGTWPAAREG